MTTGPCYKSEVNDLENSSQLQKLPLSIHGGIPDDWQTN